MRKDASDFAKDKYFNGFSDNRSVQENFDLITSFIQRGGRVVRWCWVNFQCRDVLQFGLE